MPNFVKSALFAASAVLALGAAGAASAQAFGQEMNVYVKGFGGATWPSSDDENLRTNGNTVGRADISYDTGYTLGAAVGWQATPNIGLEFEYAYRQIDYSGRATDRATGDRIDIDGKAKNGALMVNALYSFTLANPQVVPYVGTGLGAAQLDMDGDKSTWNLAYQVMAGVGYEVAPQWTLYGEGRWFGTTESKVWPEKGLATDLSFGTFDLLIGAKYAF